LTQTAIFIGRDSSRGCLADGFGPGTGDGVKFCAVGNRSGRVGEEEMGELGLVEGTAVATRSRAVTIAAELRWPLLLWTTMVCWTAVLLILVRSYFLDFRFGRYDLGNMVQAVWSTAEGRPLETTFGTGEQAVRLAGHADPILVLLAPFWMLAPSPLTLAAVQIAACAMGALPVFWLARRHLGSERSAGLLALSYLSYPWLAWAALDAVHPVTVAVPLLLYAIWFLDSHRLWAFAGCAILVAASGELMGLPLAGLGLWYWHAHGRRRAGLVIAGAGFAWSLIAVKVIVPYFQGGDSPFYSYYESVGGSPEGVLRTLFTDPDKIASALVTGADLGYVVALAVPLAGLFVLTPGLALSALPQLAANGLSSITAAMDPRSHHVSGILAFLIAGSVLGIARLPSARHVKTAAAVLVLCVGSSLLLGPWPGLPARDRLWPDDIPTVDNVEALRNAVASIPDGVAVAATNKAGSHLSARKEFFSIPRIENAEWVVIDMHDPWVPLPPRKPIRSTWGRKDPVLLEALRRQLERSSDWYRVSAAHGVLVFRRVQS
jgi:uncharacterized membrane protein